MSFKQNNMINLGNYEEYFILYMDNELAAEQKLMVEDFIAQHSQLGEELDMLMNTKLPLDEVSFAGKEDLLSSAMKVNAVDESLLLYIDNELPAAEKKAVEQKISSNTDFALQHALLVQTKLDASENISYPNKKELYRHTERVVAFTLWMRIAAAIVILFVSSLFFLLNNSSKPVDAVAINNAPVQNTPVIKSPSVPPQQHIQNTEPVKEEITIAKAAGQRQQNVGETNAVRKEANKINATATHAENAVAYEDTKQREVIQLDANRMTAEPTIDVNKIITQDAVTPAITASLNTVETPLEPAVTDGDFKNTKRSSAKGFFRKVSRFIERNTGIGTANADNELLIGAVSIKLK